MKTSKIKIITFFSLMLLGINKTLAASSSFYNNPIGGSSSPVAQVVKASLTENMLRIINYILGLLGIIAVIMIPLGLIIAIVLINKKEKVKGFFDKRSGLGENSIIPEEIKKWNWGAAILSPFWGIYFRVWYFLLILVPFVGMIWWIVLGLKGNEWAWRKNKWESVEKFKEAQKGWNKWGVIMLVAPFIIIILLMIFPLILRFFS